MKNLSLYFLTVLIAMFAIGCDDDPDDPTNPDVTDPPIASFQFAIDDNDYSTVAFTNFSQNADEYAWDFGDSNSSTEENPVHTYAAGGTYTVVLTATSGSESATFSQTFDIVDPGESARLLHGGSSKTWRLFREGVSMSVGPNADDQSWWPGLENDGTRPCMYAHEFTFTSDGQYIFDDKGMYWAEFGLFNNVDGCTMNQDEGCYDSTNGMLNACGDDVSTWASGTHQYAYDPSLGTLTLTGDGAWIGIPKLATTAETLTPQTSVTPQISIEEFVGYDVMTVVYDYGSIYWPIKYASYSDASLEPELDDTPPVVDVFGEDLPDITPDELFRSFASADASEWILLDTITSGSGIEFGVDDPADASAAKVGLFTRAETAYQELQFQTAPDKSDVLFDNLSTITLDVYLPSSNVYSEGGLTKDVNIGIADRSEVQEWWTDNTVYTNDGADIAFDQWVTLTYDLTVPNGGSNPKERSSYDMFFISIGGGGHSVGGTFYVRNFRIN